MSDHPLISNSIKGYLEQHNLEQVVNRSIALVLKSKPVDPLGSIAAAIIAVLIRILSAHNLFFLFCFSCAAILEHPCVCSPCRERNAVLRKHENDKDRRLH